MVKKCITLEKLSEMINEEHGINPDFSQLIKQKSNSSSSSSSSSNNRSSKKSSRGGNEVYVPKCTALDASILVAVLGSITLGVCVSIPNLVNKDLITARIKAYINNQTYNGTNATNSTLLVAAIQGFRQSVGDIHNLLTLMCKTINEMRKTTPLMGGKSKRRSNNKRKMTKKRRRPNR